MITLEKVIKMDISAAHTENIGHQNETRACIKGDEHGDNVKETVKDLYNEGHHDGSQCARDENEAMAENHDAPETSGNSTNHTATKYSPDHENQDPLFENSDEDDDPLNKTTTSAKREPPESVSTMNLQSEAHDSTVYNSKENHEGGVHLTHTDTSGDSKNENSDSDEHKTDQIYSSDKDEDTEQSEEKSDVKETPQTKKRSSEEVTDDVNEHTAALSSEKDMEAVKTGDKETDDDNPLEEDDEGNRSNKEEDYGLEENDTSLNEDHKTASETDQKDSSEKEGRTDQFGESEEEGGEKPTKKENDTRKREEDDDELEGEASSKEDRKVAKESKPKTEGEIMLEKAQKLMQLGRMTDDERWDRVGRLSDMIKLKTMTSKEKKRTMESSATGKVPFQLPQKSNTQYLSNKGDTNRSKTNRATGDDDNVIILSDSDDEMEAANTRESRDKDSDVKMEKIGEDSAVNEETARLKQEIEQLQTRLQSWTDSNGQGLKSAEVENIVHPLIAHLAASSGRATSTLQNALREGQLPDAFQSDEMLSFLAKRETRVKSNGKTTATVSGVSFQPRSLNDGVEMKGEYARKMLRTALKNTELLQTANNSARNLGYRSAVAQEIGNMRRKLRRMQQRLSEKMERMNRTAEEKRLKAEGKGKLRAQRFLSRIGVDLAPETSSPSIHPLNASVQYNSETSPSLHLDEEYDGTNATSDNLAPKVSMSPVSKEDGDNAGLNHSLEKNSSGTVTMTEQANSFETTDSKNGNNTTESVAETDSTLPRVKRTYGSRQRTDQAKMQTARSSAGAAHDIKAQQDTATDSITHGDVDNAGGEASIDFQDGYSEVVQTSVQVNELTNLSDASISAKDSENKGSGQGEATETIDAHNSPLAQNASSDQYSSQQRQLIGAKHHLAEDGTITKAVKQPTLFGLLSGSTTKTSEDTSNEWQKSEDAAGGSKASSMFRNFFERKQRSEDKTENAGEAQDSVDEQDDSEESVAEDAAQESDDEDDTDNKDSSEPSEKKEKGPKNSKYVEMIRKDLERESKRKKEKDEYRQALLAQGKSEEEMEELIEAEASEGEEEDEQARQLSMIGNFTNDDEKQKKEASAEEQNEEQEALGYNVDLNEALEGIVDDVSSDEEDDVDQAFVAELQRKLDEQQVKTVIRAVKEGHNRYRKKRRKSSNRARANLEQMDDAEEAFEEYDDEAAFEQRELQKRERGAEEFGARVATEDKDLAAEDGDLFDSESDEDETGKEDQSENGDDDDEDEEGNFDVQSALRKAVQKCRQRTKGSVEPQQNEAVDENGGSPEETEGAIMVRKRRRGACMFSYGEDLNKLRREESQTQRSQLSSNHEEVSPLDSLVDNDVSPNTKSDEAEASPLERGTSDNGALAETGTKTGQPVSAGQQQHKYVGTGTGVAVTTKIPASSSSSSSASPKASGEGIANSESTGGSMLQQALRSVGIAAPSATSDVGTASEAQTVPLERSSSAPPEFVDRHASDSILMRGFSDQPFGSETTLNDMDSLMHQASNMDGTSQHSNSAVNWLNLDSLPDWDSHSKHAQMSLKRQNDGNMTGSNLHQAGSASRGGRVSTKGARGFVFQKKKSDQSKPCTTSGQSTESKEPQVNQSTSKPDGKSQLGKRANSMLMRALSETNGTVQAKPSRSAKKPRL